MKQQATVMHYFNLTNKYLVYGVILLTLFVTACSSTDDDIETADNVKQEEKSNEESTQSESNSALDRQFEQEENHVTSIQQEQPANVNFEAVIVARVVDGDTIKLADGRRVRLIGVNTPESTTRTEEFGKEASQYTKSVLSGRQVWLQKDVSETDRFDRSLRIVWLEIPSDDMDENEIRTKMFNSALVLNGYAEPSTYPPDVKYSEFFVQFAREARENNIGLWAYGENGTTKGDLDYSENKSSTNTSKSTTGSSEGKEAYQNCTELRKVHPDGVPSTHPAYAPKHDRDQDGWACERS